MDPGAQSSPESIACGRERRRNLALAPVVGIDPTGIYVALSRGVRSRPLFAELSSAPGWRRGVERRIAGIGSYRDGGRPHLCSSAASPLSKNADYNRRSARRGVAGDGGRASARDAARALDSDYGDQFFEKLRAALDWSLVCRVSHDRNTRRSIHRRGVGGWLLLCGAPLWRRCAARNAEPVQEAQVEANAAVVEPLETVHAISRR